jgi:exosortase J
MSTPSPGAQTLAEPTGGALTLPKTLSLPAAAAMATVLSACGVFAVFSSVIYLWALWTTDPLKSIGGFIPIVSLVLILRVWRSLGWEMRGTWWGLAVLAVLIALVHLRDHAILELILTPSWTIFVPPHSLVAFGYVVGAVLLFGGTRLFRAALFPICLIWFVNPVPHVFNVWIDLPLQHAAATIARGFAHALGQQLTNDQLRLMFTPDFGMFIAPGCDGIRGAITMGFIALIAGYIYKFRPSIHALVVAGAVMLGYVFNFVRLCVLVLYYIVALHITWLQNRAEMGDYIIGALLFFLATTLLFMVIRRFSPGRDLRPPKFAAAPDVAGKLAPKSFLPRWSAMLLLVLLGSVTYVRAIVEQRHQPRAITDPKALGLFPQRVGNYTLDREWNEYLVAGGPLIFYWADYRPADGSGLVAVGISPVLGAHDTLICHSARGEDWLWHGDLAFPTVSEPTNFSASFFNDGATQYMEATTVCTGTVCGQYASSRTHFGFVYSRPDTHTLLSQSPSRPIPVLLRTETTDVELSANAARSQLTDNLRKFLSGADIAEFSRPYRQP